MLNKEGQKVGEPEVTQPAVQFEGQMATGQPPACYQVPQLWRTWECQQRTFSSGNIRVISKRVPLRSIPHPPQCLPEHTAEPATKQALQRQEQHHQSCSPSSKMAGSSWDWHINPQTLCNPKRPNSTSAWRRWAIIIWEAMEETLRLHLQLWIAVNSTKFHHSQSTFSSATISIFFFFCSRSFWKSLKISLFGFLNLTKTHLCRLSRWHFPLVPTWQQIFQSLRMLCMHRNISGYFSHNQKKTNPRAALAGGFRPAPWPPRDPSCLAAAVRGQAGKFAFNVKLDIETNRLLFFSPQKKNPKLLPKYFAIKHILRQ